MPDPEHREHRIPKLVEGNYEQWRFLMEAILIAADLWEVVGPEDPELVYKGVKGEKEKKKKQQQGRAKIVLELSASQLPFVMGMENPREIWKVLETIHRSASVNSILSLRRCFFRMTKSETETTMSWISRVRARALELSHTPCPASSIDAILVITDGLPPAFETVVSALDGLPFEEITIANVVARIAGHEAHLNRSIENETNTSNSLVAFSRNNHNRKKSLKCFNCGGIGHIKSECPSEDVDANVLETNVFDEIDDEIRL